LAQIFRSTLSLHREYDAGASKGWRHPRRAADGHQVWIPEHENQSAERQEQSTGACCEIWSGVHSESAERCYCKAWLSGTGTMHGLRNAAVRMLADAGCSIMTATGHRSLKKVERYTRDAGAEEAGAICRSQAGTQREGNIEWQTTPRPRPAMERSLKSWDNFTLRD